MSFAAKMARKEPPVGSDTWLQPWVQLKYYSYHPCIFPAMIKTVSPEAGAGQWVHVYDREGKYFGQGFYNAKARVPLRVYYHGDEPMSEDYLTQLIDRGIAFRLETLQLRQSTDAFRVIHSDGDGLSGLVVDCYDDTLSVEVHSLGVFQRLPQWLPYLHQRLGTKRVVVEIEDRVAKMEGIPDFHRLSDNVRTVKIRENGVRFEVDFESGHKTGFFCDQRDNRRYFASLVKGLRVLDLCCYTGGFGIMAMVQGGATEVTGVDLDEKAIAQAKRNANLNQARIEYIHVDAFSYARQMQRNTERWDAVVLDPPKLILSREEVADGWHKYQDLNELAIDLVKPGGLLATCSCSGLLSAGDFEQILIKAAHRRKRRLQIFNRTGAAPDHPILSTCPESNYLKVLWARVL